MSKVMNMVGRLLETREKLLAEITSLNFEKLNFSHDPQSWSIAQVCHHLYLTEIAFTKGLVYGLTSEGKKVEPKSLDFLADRSHKVDAPSMVLPSSEPMTMDEITNFLKESRNQLSEVINTIENKSILFEKSAKHPFFGQLPLIQWIELIYLHEQRHIEQIKDIKVYN